MDGFITLTGIDPSVQVSLPLAQKFVLAHASPFIQCASVINRQLLLSYSPSSHYLFLTLKAYTIALTAGSQTHQKTLKIWAAGAFSTPP
jgi:hypothetical protein